jgi:hypothetical protein
LFLHFFDLKSTMRSETIVLLGLASVSLTAAFITPTPAFCDHVRHESSPRTISTLLNAHGPGNIIRPPNEFSRKFNVDSVLGGGPRQRDYRTSIEAKEEERAGLADRFDLSNIDKLQAEVTLRKEGKLGGSTRGEFLLEFFNVAFEFVVCDFF